MRKVIGLNPNHINAHYNKTVQSALGYEEAAIGSYSKVLELDPTYKTSPCLKASDLSF